MVNDPNLILIQIINLVKSAMLALLPLIAGVVIVALGFAGHARWPGVQRKIAATEIPKLNPFPGIAKMFSAQTGAELLKAILKIVYGQYRRVFLWHHWPEMMRLISESLMTAMKNALNLVGLCSLLVVLSIIPMVAFDVIFQIYSHIKSCECRVRTSAMNINRWKATRTLRAVSARCSVPPRVGA